MVRRRIDDDGNGDGLNQAAGGLAGFGLGVLAGMGAGAQVTGPVGVLFPPWGGLFIIGCGIAGGIFGAIAGLAAAGWGRTGRGEPIPEEEN